MRAQASARPAEGGPLQEATDPEAELRGRGVGATGGAGQVTDETVKKPKPFEETGELGADRRQAVDESRARGRTTVGDLVASGVAEDGTASSAWRRRWPHDRFAGFGAGEDGEELPARVTGAVKLR